MVDGYLPLTTLGPLKRSIVSSAASKFYFAFLDGQLQLQAFRADAS